MEFERDYVVKKRRERTDQSFEESGNVKREATARKGNRTKVWPEYNRARMGRVSRKGKLLFHDKDEEIFSRLHLDCKLFEERSQVVTTFPIPL